MKELFDGAGALQVLWKVYVPLAHTEGGLSASVSRDSAAPYLRFMKISLS